MFIINPFNLLLFMTLFLFLLGLASSITGILLLTRRAASQDLKTLAVQTTRLAQKGLAEDVAGLVGNASSLMEAMNQLVRTTAGVGVFLTLIGVILMGIACWLALQLYRMPL